MQPYQRASEAIKKNSETSKNLIKGAANLGIGLATGGVAAVGANAILGKIIPFLSQYIPAGIALKGIAKVSPNLSKFINLSLQSDNSEADVVNFIREKVSPKQEEEEEMEQAQPQQPQAGPLFQGTHGPVPGSIRGQLQGQQQPQAPQAAQQPGPGQQALMQVIQQLQQARGR